MAAATATAIQTQINLNSINKWIQIDYRKSILNEFGWIEFQIN